MKININNPTEYFYLQTSQRLNNILFTIEQTYASNSRIKLYCSLATDVCRLGVWRAGQPNGTISLGYIPAFSNRK